MFVFLFFLTPILFCFFLFLFFLISSYFCFFSYLICQLYHIYCTSHIRYMTYNEAAFSFCRDHAIRRQMGGRTVWCGFGVGAGEQMSTRVSRTNFRGDICVGVSRTTRQHSLFGCPEQTSEQALAGISVQSDSFSVQNNSFRVKCGSVQNKELW